MSHNFETEDARIAAAKVTGRNIAAYDIRSGRTEPREMDNMQVWSHLAAVGFSRLGTRMYTLPFMDAYRAEFIRLRLEYIRGEIEAERISYGEIVELQGLAEHINSGDVQLLEWAGVPEHAQEFPDGTRVVWTDPDGGDERTGIVKGIIDGDDAYLLDFGDGSETQAYAHELRAE